MKPTATKNQLTPAEAKRRAELELIILPGLKGCIEVGAALREMSDDRLYRNTHPTFKDYVQETYKISVRRAYELVEAAEVVQSLPENVRHAAHLNARQAAELARVPKKKRAKVLKVAQVHAEANCKPVTAKGIAKAAESVLHPPASDEPPGLVEWGQPVEQVEPEEADYFPSFQASLKDLIRNIPRGVDLRPYLSALHVEAAFLSNKVNANRNNSAYV